MKIYMNLRNGVLGILIANLFVSTTFLTDISMKEELVRIVIYSVLIEFAFYSTHRMMHWNKLLFKYIHKEHHLEMEPSPIDAYILTPAESASVVFSFTFPNFIRFLITKRGMILVQTIHLIFGILVHGALKSVRHHMLHHKYLKGNYSGIYPFWDMVFGTYLSV